MLDRRENSELVRLIGELDHFRGTWRKMQEIRDERLVQLRKVATIESTTSSTRIEGVVLTDETRCARTKIPWAVSARCPTQPSLHSSPESPRRE